MDDFISKHSDRISVPDHFDSGLVLRFTCEDFDAVSIPREEKLLFLAHAILNNNVSFPYKRFSMEHQDVLSSFDRLKNFKRPLVNVTAKKTYSVINQESRGIIPLYYPQKFKKQSMGFVFTEDDYHSIDKYTDYFQEPARMSAVKNIDMNRFERSPREMWHCHLKLIEDVVENALQRGEVNPETLREEIYSHPLIYECTQFRATATKLTVELFGATRVLDISSGWGDRLIGCLAAKSVKRYVGCDPNGNLFDGYNEILETFGTNDKNILLLNQPFESASLPDEKFDLVFTSPPFFDFEIYDRKDRNQSMKAHRKFSSWMTDFLFASLRKAWSVLDDNGIMALHVSDIPGREIAEPMQLFIQGYLPNAKLTGVLNYVSNDKARPVWLSKKIPGKMNIQDVDIVIRARKALRIYFPGLYPGNDNSVSFDSPVSIRNFIKDDARELSILTIEGLIASDSDQKNNFVMKYISQHPDLYLFRKTTEVCLVATINNFPVGTISWDGKEIVRFSVSSECRRRGIGSMLWNKILEKLSDRGIKNVSLQTTSNSISIPFYTSLKGLRMIRGSKSFDGIYKIYFDGDISDMI